MIRFSTACAATALLLAAPDWAAADAVHSIDYSYYPVTGRTPAEIYRTILNRGPMVAGERAIAATEARGVQNFGLQQSGSSCRVVDYRLNFNFTVQLPRPVYLSALKPRDRTLWQQFAVFLKAHELQHTKLWLGCAADMQRKALGIKTASCSDAKQRVEELWRKMRASCDRLQANFDVEQRSELLEQPFMQRVIRGN